MFVIDSEANKLKNPDKLWCVVLREVSNPENIHVFENIHERGDGWNGLVAFLRTVQALVGHNCLGFDLPVLALFGITFDPNRVVDTLVVSRLVNYNIAGGHSLEAWGERLGEKKIGLDISDWSCYTKDILERCIQDTLVNLKVYNYLSKYIFNPSFKDALRLEHQIAIICNELKENGFAFNKLKAEELYNEIALRLKEIDNNLTLSFPPKKVKVGEITPRFTKSGAIHATDFRRLRDGGIPEPYDARTYELFEEQPYDPNSIKQTIDRLWEAGWKPTEKTKGHIELHSRRKRSGPRVESSEELELRKSRFERYGWKLSEENLRTLPDSAPEGARRLVERLLLASRLSDLEEWLGLLEETPDGSHRIHASFNGIGSWTHRLSSNNPNLQNIPVAKHTEKETEIEKLANDINDRMRVLWTVPKGKRLIGVDADGIQMRIFAHYVNDERLIKALIEGKKSDGTDIHSLHWKALGEACKGRDPAKTFIYAWLLGAGAPKVAEILGCSVAQAKAAILRFIEFYPGLGSLKQDVIPKDFERGYFLGLDGRYVATPRESDHFVLAGYLQSGETVVMKRACTLWNQQLRAERIPFKFVTWPHDEWQTEIDDDDEIADYVTSIQMRSIVSAGRDLGLNCPLAATRAQRADGFIGGYSWKDTH